MGLVSSTSTCSGKSGTKFFDPAVFVIGILFGISITNVDDPLPVAVAEAVFDANGDELVSLDPKILAFLTSTGSNRFDMLELRERNDK